MSKHIVESYDVKDFIEIRNTGKFGSIRVGNMFSPRVAEHIKSKSSDNIPMIQINDAHHHIMLDQPLAFSAAIDALLQNFRQ